MIKIKIFQFNPLAVNSYLLWDETHEAVLVDCGCATNNEEQTLKAFVYEQKLTLKRLLCTHLHFDHIIGNEFIISTFGVHPEAHQNDVEGLPPPNVQTQAMQLPDSVKFGDVKLFLQENAIVRFGNSELLPLLTPGHSPGSLSYYSKTDGFILSGDALFKENIGRTDLWNGDYTTLVNAIKTKILTLPDHTIVYPGHGDQTTVVHEKNYNPFL